MKNLLLIFCLLFSVQVSFANKVDDLKTDNDVKKFLIPLNKEFSGNDAQEVNVLSTEKIISRFSIARKWKIRNWEKVDFNNDGRTDLLAVVQWGDYLRNFIAVDKGDNTFQLLNINYSYENICELINSIKEGNERLILFHVIKPIPQKNKPLKQWARDSSETDTLIYKFNAIVEHNKNPSDYKIDSITFNTGACFGTCPVMEIKIGPTGYATYATDRYSNKTKTFRCVVKKQDLANIYAIVNYLSIKKLKNNYAVRLTDQPTYTTRIKFSDGTVKEISDYGVMCTFGLRALYPMFLDLTENQKWIAVKK